jgi:hypothetical protein
MVGTQDASKFNMEEGDFFKLKNLIFCSINYEFYFLLFWCTSALSFVVCMFYVCFSWKSQTFQNSKLQIFNL